MRITALLSLALLAGACVSDRSRAQEAIAAAEEALAPIANEAGRVVPDQLKPLTDAVAVAKDYMGRREYDSALAMVQGVPDKTDSLAQAIVREKAAITEEMNTLNAAMPRNLAAVKSRLDRLSPRRLPRGMSRETFDSVQATYQEGIAEWPRIMTAYTEGQLHDAISRATALKLRVSRAMEAVGLAADARAWSNTVEPRP
jgi:hypothetical protein